MNWIDVFSRIAHVTTAIVLMGGSTFILFVLHPILSRATDAPSDLSVFIIDRWKRFVHVGILVFLISGIYNYMRAIPNHHGDGPYHMMMGIKMMLAFGVFFIASALVGRSKAFEKMRTQRGKWLNLMVLLAFIIVSISGFLKIRGIQAPSNAVETNGVEVVAK